MRKATCAAVTAAALLTLSSAAGAQPRFDVYGGGQITHRSPETRWLDRCGPTRTSASVKAA